MSKMVKNVESKEIYFKKYKSTSKNAVFKKGVVSSCFRGEPGCDPCLRA